MMETGIVRKIEDDLVTVVCSATPSCEGCTACASGADGARTLQARNRTGAPLQEGDEVAVRVSASVAAQASFLILVLPLGMFVLGYFLVQALAPASAEPLRVLGGLGGLGGGIGLNFLLRGKHRDLPEVVAVRARS
jgi:positive regulator of sigma E activity